MAIVLLISIAKGVQADVQREVEDLGVNILIVIPTRLEDGQMFAPGIMGVSYLSLDDYARGRSVEGVIRGTPLTFVGSGLEAEGRKSPTTMVMATRSDWFEMRPVQMAEGRTHSAEDAMKPVCVIGSIAKKKLFPEETAIGKSIQYNGKEFEIIGVTQDKEANSSLFSMGSFENVMYIPFDYFREWQPNSQIDRLLYQTSPKQEPKSLVAAMDKVMGERLNRETYSVLTQEDLLKLVFKLMEILTWLLTGLTSIGLVVGGVGIMTIMLMAVTERRREIGIRKAAGAKNSDIFTQFLYESSLLGLIGGTAGLGVSILACWALATWTPIKPLITAETVGLSFLVSVGVGALFGLLPANQAARKDPVESLRYE